MEDKRCYFAVDLGATSGRTILGTLADGRLEQEELTRFPNNLIETGGHFYWDIYALYFEMIRGLKEVARRGITLTYLLGIILTSLAGAGLAMRKRRKAA